MKNRLKIIAVVCLMLVVGGGVGFWVCRLTDPSVSSDVRVVRQKMSKESGIKKITEITLGKKGGKTSVKIVERDLRRPDVLHVSAAENDEVDEAELTELQKGILKELQDALDGNDLKAVRKALSKFVASTDRGGLGGLVPKCMRQRAVEALGWFGRKAAVDLIEYMADLDEGVADAAFSQFELALQDADMSARERSQLMASTMKALTNRDNIDSLLFNLNDMPNSLKAATVEAILTTGSDQAKSVMTEQLEQYLDDAVKTVDDIRKWASENPDDGAERDSASGSGEPEVELSAGERASKIVAKLQLMNDPDAIDNLLCDLNDLPNSLKASTVEQILTKGSAQAKSTMAEQLEFYLDDGVKTVDDVHKWAAKNPDVD